MTTPTVSGIFRGMGTEDRGRALGEREPALSYLKPQLQEFDYCQETRSLSQQAYSSSKCLIVRHKVVQRREQFYSPLDDLAFEVTFPDQFDLPVS